MKKFIFLLLLTIFTNNALAQLNQNSFTHYNELDGTDIYCTISDRFGNIWIGSQSGLVRYDGYEFKHFYFDPNDSGSLKDIVVWSLFEDKKENIWIGGLGCINKYDPKTKSFKRYEYDRLIELPPSGQSGISTITEDHNGRIYFGVSSPIGENINKALIYYDEKTDKLNSFKNPDNFNIDNVFSLVTDHQGAIWFSAWSGFFKIDTNNQISEIKFDAKDNQSKESISFGSLKFDASNMLWMLSNQNKLCSYNAITKEFDSFPIKIGSDTKSASFYSSNIAIDKENNIYVGSNNGILLFDKKTETFQLIKTQDAEKEEVLNITSLANDSFGNIWIGTIAKGLYKYEKRIRLESYINPLDKATRLVGWIGIPTETSDGKIWFIEENGNPDNSGLTVMDVPTRTFKSFTYKSIFREFKHLFNLYLPNKDEIYLCASDGIYIYSIKNNTAKKIVLKGVPKNIKDIYNLYKDSLGNFWVFSFQGVYKRSNNSTVFTHYDLSKFPEGNTGSNTVTRFFESKNNRLWMITNNGLFSYNYKTNKMERHGYDNKKGDVFISQDINSFYEDKNGIAWVGTWQGGLSRYDVNTKKIKTYTRTDGLPSMSIQGILADEKNNTLWLSTFNGISRFDIKTGQFNNFTLDDGIQGQLYADGSYLKTAGGLLIFGGGNGIDVINPKAVFKNSKPPNVFITDFKVDNKSIINENNDTLKKGIYDTKAIDLRFNQNNITIDFIGIHYTNPSQNKYAYKLENYDKDWREVSNQRSAYYSNLPPGKYIFKVKSANSFGIWSEKGASIEINILPPWWQTWWAYCIYGLLLIMAIIGTDKFQRHRILQAERQKNQKRELEQAKEIEKAYTELKATQSQLIQSEKMASLGELTAGIAHEIQNPLNFVNNFSEVSAELLAEMNGALENGDIEEAKALSNDVIENLGKINHHGKRADAIVKGMLQHSRSSSGKKEPTDLNALCDEYLRLSYHGLRAKDKSFNATMNIDFDETIGKINIIPQDFGRVILNLLNNAFYAVNEKKKSLPNPEVEIYEPKVSIITKKINNTVEIKVIDNGNGIPENIVGKIFQPFFTTKPAGQGTGLGLSLSYDIIKSQEGALNVQSNSTGTTFTIFLKI